MQPRCSRRDGLGQEEARILVGHDNGSILRETVEQTPASPHCRFNVGEIEHRRAVQRASVVGHAVNHKAVQPIGGKRIIDSQRLEHDERPIQLDRPRHRAIQCEIRRGSPRGDHPIDDELTRRIDGTIVGGAHALGRGTFPETLGSGRHLKVRL